MPAQLNDELVKLSQAFAVLKQRLDRKSIEALGKQVFSLRQLLKEILTSLDVLKNDNELSDTKLKEWEQLRPETKLERLKKVAEKVTIEESTELSAFFTNVSNAVIEAQKNLNEFSQQYITELEETKSPIPPTFFAIPSLKAEMKLGVSEMTSKGVNVILFKNEEQKERFFESAITFELVSTPPAPATRPKEESEKVSQPSVAAPLSPSALRAEEEKALLPAAAKERAQVNELLTRLDETRAAVETAAEIITEAKAPEKPKTRKPLLSFRKKKAQSKKASTSKSRAKKSAKKSR